MHKIANSYLQIHDMYNKCNIQKKTYSELRGEIEASRYALVAASYRNIG